MTRPDLPPTEAPPAAAVPGEPMVQAPEPSPTAPSDGGVPAAAAPRRGRGGRRRGRVIGAAGEAASAHGVETPGDPVPHQRLGDGAWTDPDPSMAGHGPGNGAGPASSAGDAPPARPSMSARLGAVPDAPRDDLPPAPPTAPQTDAAQPAPPAIDARDRADVTDRVLLVPEVLPPTAPAPRIVPSAPEVAPSTTELPPQAPPVAPEPEPAPYDLAADDPALAFEPPATRVRNRRPRVRRVTRVVRTIDTWSVFKVALLFAAVLYVSALLSGVLLWNVAYATGTIDNAERFMESFGWQTFEFHGGEIFHDAWIIGLFAAAGLVGMAVLAAATFNLVSDLVGGVRVTVLEEEMVVRPVSRRRKQRIRKAPPRAATAAPPSPSPSAPAGEPGTELAPRPRHLPTQ